MTRNGKESPGFSRGEERQRLWLEDYIDADLAAMDQPQLLVPTALGDQLLADAEKESGR
jgi:hypothetical protein